MQLTEQNERETECLHTRETQFMNLYSFYKYHTNNSGYIQHMIMLKQLNKRTHTVH